MSPTKRELIQSNYGLNYLGRWMTQPVMPLLFIDGGKHGGLDQWRLQEFATWYSFV
jgi:hypothetical protein